MDKEGSLGQGGLLRGLGSRGPSSVGLSPYFNVDPNYLNTQTPEFILSQDHQRGRMESSFTAIGSSIVLGACVGGVYGMVDGLRQTRDLRSKTRRMQLTNYTLKSGAKLANAMGTLAVVYSSLHLMLSYKIEEDNEMKSIITGALTGALYKSTAGIKRCGIAAAIGAGAAALWSGAIKKDERLANFV